MKICRSVNRSFKKVYEAFNRSFSEAFPMHSWGLTVRGVSFSRFLRSGGLFNAFPRYISLFSSIIAEKLPFTAKTC